MSDKMKPSTETETETGQNKGAGLRICILFKNYPDRGFTYKEVLRITGLPVGTVKSRIHKLMKWGIIRRYKTIPRQPYIYIIDNEKKALDYIENRLGFDEGRDTPTPNNRGLTEIPQELHHEIYQVRLTDAEWKRSEPLFNRPDANKDRGNQRILQRKSFTMVISPNTMKGTLYPKGTAWRGELNRLLPDLAQRLSKQVELAHKGVSFNAEVWQNFKLQSDDLKLIFASSHYWDELDAEGREYAVNTLMKRIMTDAFDQTTYDAIMVKLLEEISGRINGMEGNMLKMALALEKITQILSGSGPEAKAQGEIQDNDYDDIGGMFG